MLIEIEPGDWAGILDSLRPSIGRYNWLIRLLTWRKRQIGYFPLGLHRRLQRFISPTRPYFIGRTRQGILFLGDAREYDSCHWAVGDPPDEQLIARALELWRSRRGIYLDVGANCGVVAASMAKLRNEPIPIVAFEPVPATAARAAATFALNGLTTARLFQVAIGDENKEILLFERERHSGGASAVRSNDAVRDVRVTCRTLESLVPTLGPERISLLKVDVEGFEPQVLRGAKQLLAQHRPGVIYEYNAPAFGESGWTIARMNDLVQGSGSYTFHGFSEDGVLVPDVTHFKGRHVDVICVPETRQSDQLVPEI